MLSNRYYKLYFGSANRLNWNEIRRVWESSECLENHQCGLMGRLFVLGVAGFCDQDKVQAITRITEGGRDGILRVGRGSI